jgi:hypothetical protein
MKILFLFCDMLRADFFNTYNTKCPSNELDSWFKKIGGTAYTNAYSPAPDTARSLACLFTGKYPKNHGCQKRIHYPEYFLRDDIDNIFKLLLDKDFKIFVREVYAEKACGILPGNIATNSSIYRDSDLSTVVSKINASIEKDENSFSFISLPDSHWACDDYGYHPFGLDYGIKRLSKAFKTIFNTLSMDSFDYIVLFSDHGMKITNDLDSLEKDSFLNKDRTQLVLQVKEKKPKGLTKNEDLKSIMDVFPFILDNLNISYNDVDGINITKNEPREIIFEDELIYIPSINGFHDIWAVKNCGGLYVRRLKSYKLYNNNNVVIKQGGGEGVEDYDTLLTEHSCSFKQRIKESNVLSYYSGINKKLTEDGYPDGYSDDIPRKHLYLSFFSHLLLRIKRRYLHWKYKGKVNY